MIFVKDLNITVKFLMEISTMYKYEVDCLKRQGLNIEFVWIKGHDGNKWNERADELAKKGIELNKNNLNALFTTEFDTKEIVNE